MDMELENPDQLQIYEIKGQDFESELYKIFNLL
jgi:hypothetical protein